MRAGFLTLLLTLLCGEARAEWPVERNAQQLQAREWKLGLWGVDVGVQRHLQVGTLWPTWALLGPNIHLKSQLFSLRGWQLAAELSFFYLNLDNLRWFGIDDLKGSFTVLPMELFLDKQLLPRLLVGAGAGYVLTHTSPRYDPESLSGSGAYDSMLLRGHATAQATHHLWLILEVDWVLHQLAGAIGSVDKQIDDYTHVRGRARAVASPIDPGRGGAVTLSMLVRAGRFGGRLGVGYGNFALPRVKVVCPEPIPYFTLDLFARFGGHGL